jgi:methylenetetrahydrofolate reductase (NADPH)
VRRAGLVPVPHISARRLTSPAELESFLNGLTARAGVDHVFVVAGDQGDPQGPYEDALAVIASGVLGKYGIRRVSIAGYPEGHPVISTPALWQALQAKQETLARLGLEGEIMTQFSFDAEPVVAWLAAVRAAGIDLPVRIGVAGPASVKTLLRFATRCGVGASAKVMSKYGLSLTRLLGTAGPDPFLADLTERLVPTVHGKIMLHLYPFGGLRKTAEWARDYINK